jgi:hypothetical protein
MIRGREVWSVEVYISRLEAAVQECSFSSWLLAHVTTLKIEMEKLASVEWVFHGNAKFKNEGDTYAVVPRNVSDVGQRIYEQAEMMWKELSNGGICSD